MKYIIIGLGNYGGGLAEELMAIGHEVIGVDQNEGRVDNLKDKITTAFVLDAPYLQNYIRLVYYLHLSSPLDVI